jgi:hypothetical protein
MGRALGSWITATGLKKFNAEVLRDALLTDKEKFKRAGIEIPSDLESKSLDYARLTDYFHGEHDSQVLEESLFCAIKLDSEEGWESVQAEIHKSGIPYTEPEGRCIGNACHCLLAWLLLKDSLPYLLETSYGKIQTSHAFTLHLHPLNSWLSEQDFRKPDAKSIKDAETALAEHYGATTGKAWCRIIHFDCYEDEVWFMIRYPGRIECKPVLDGDEEKDDATTPLFFHTVVYDRKNCMLRTTVKAQKLCSKLRLAFGKMLFNDGNAFVNAPMDLERLLKVDRIKDRWEHISNRDPKAPIQNVHIVRMSCSIKGLGSTKTTFAFQEKDRRTLFEGDLFGLSSPADGVPRSPEKIALDSASEISWIQIGFDLVSDNGWKRKKGKVTIKQGNTIGLEQDSGARHLLDFIYEHGIISKRDCNQRAS